MCRPAAEADYWIRLHRHAMACRFEITLGGEHASHVAAARHALDEVEGIEARISAFRPTSDLARVNGSAATGAVVIDRQLLSLLMLCQVIYRDTDGAFDVTSTPLSRCWGFMGGHQKARRLPSRDDIDSARHAIGMEHVHIDATHQTVRFARPGLEISFGAIGKGWALDRVALGLRARGASGMLLSAGHSSVLALGAASHPWPIDLTSPHVTDRLARVELRHGSLGTSGAGEQFIEVDGQRHGHVLDPRTGRPTESDVLSVSVLAAEAAVSDALSTAFLVGGIDLARRYCNAHSAVMAVVTSGDRRTHILGTFPGATVTLH